MARADTVQRLTRVRNFGIAAHIDAGKTTLTERILYYTGVSHKIGEVHEGTTQMDYMPEERARGITITAAVTHCEWKSHDLHLIDTPGHVDFTIEVERSMRVLDGVVVVLDAVKGVEPQSETVWRQAERHRVPRIIFVNKMDRAGADFDHAVQTVIERLGGRPVVVMVPVQVGNIWALIDVIGRKLITFSGERNKDVTYGPLFGDHEITCEEWREKVVEAAADLDDGVADKYLSGEDISEDELRAALRRGTLACQIQPTFGGSALKDYGVQPVLDGVLTYLPSPLDVGAVTGQDARSGAEVRVDLTDNGPFCALAFKVQMIDTRRHVYLRIYRGKLKPGDAVWNNRRKEAERVARIFHVRADTRDRLEVATAGDIVLCAGLRWASTGDTLSDTANPVSLAPITATDPVIALSIETVKSDQDDKVQEALEKMVEEDPTLKLSVDPDSGQRLLHGMGELHLEVVLDRMQREYSVAIRTGVPRVVYRESIGSDGRGEIFIDRKLESGFTHRARVVVGVTPQPIDDGVKVIFEPSRIQVKPDGINLSPNQQQWIHEALRNESLTGPISGNPLVGVQIRCLEVELFGIESPEPVLREATARAVRAALQHADPYSLAPIMAMEVEVPGEQVGSVLGDIQSRGGMVLGMEATGSLSQLQAECPMERLFGYATALRSMTQGRGTFTLRFSRFDRI